MTNRRHTARRAKTEAARRPPFAPFRVAPPRGRLALLMGGAAVAALCLGMNAAEAGGVVLPTGGAVVAGSATIGAPANNSLTINQSSAVAILNWGAFSIGAGGAVAFDNGSGATLNRVSGNVPSELDGSLTATGSLYLVNPAGVVVGTTGRIATGGSFYASTQDVSDADFLAGKSMTFSGTSRATLVNYGQIGSLGGDVALIAREVTNAGSIDAAKGTVALAAGYEVLARDATLSDGKFLVKVGGADTAAGTLGVIRAANVELKANGGSVYALAGNTSSITVATGLDAADGKIIFTAGESGAVNVAQHIVARRHIATADGKRATKGGDVDVEGGSVAVSGTIDAAGKNAAGGTVVVTGTNVDLTSTAAIDASGSTGGVILIGGDRKGGADASFKLVARTVADADTTIIAQGATLTANGLDGNGGSIVVWSNEQTNYAGALSATGTNGDGGFAEVSSHGLLCFTGTADLLSTTGGATGSLLLDPYDVVISTGADSGAASLTGADPTGTSVINVNTLETALASASVTISTGASGSAGGDAGNITVNAPITWTSASGLTLWAYDNVNVNANISGAGAITLRADNSGTGTGTVTYNGATVTTTSGGVSVFYNPTNPSGATPGTINATEYTTPTTYAGATAYMLVNNVYDLENINNHKTGTYALGKDIDASVTQSWTNTVESGQTTAEYFAAIGYTSSYANSSSTNAFTGIFNGLNHTISNLYVSGVGLGVGLFGVVGGTTANGYNAVIENVGLISPTVVYPSGGSGNAGSLVGYASKKYGKSVTIANVYATNVSVSGNQATVVGGLIGYLATGTLSYAYVDGGTVIGGGAYTGGLVGANAGAISQTYANVAASGTEYTGGLVGANGYSPSGSGGSGTIANSYSTGTVAGNSSNSGVGTGGLVGEQYYSSGVTGAISDSYTTSVITGGPNPCGFACGAGTVTANYWETDNGTIATKGTDQSSQAGITGLSTAQMYVQSNFSGFNFTTIWAPPTTTGQDSGGGTGDSYTPGLYGVSHILVVTPNNVTTANVGSAPTYTSTYSGLQGEDTLNTPAVLTSTDGAAANYAVGVYTISVKTAPGVNSASAYRVIDNTGALTIQAATSVNYATANQTTTYNSSAVATSTVVVTLTNASTSATIADANLTPTVVFQQGGSTVANVVSAGTYQEVVTGFTGSDASLYQLAASGNTIGTLTINPATLTIATQGAIASTQVYNGSAAATVTNNGALGGTIYGGDNPTLSLSAQYASANVGSNETVTGSYTLTGPGASNYTISNNTFSATGSITPATLTIATAGAVASTKVYDGATNATVTSDGTLGGVISGDTVALTLTAAYSDKNVGTGKTVTGTYALTGASDANYTLATNAFSSTAAITPATLTIATAGAVANKVYDGTTAATVATDGALSGVISGDVVTLTLGGVAFTTKDAGAAKAVTGIYAISGADAGNYSFTATSFTGAAAITPATLTIATAGAVAPTKVYDGTTSATVTSNGALDGVISGDTVALTLTAAYSDKNVGTGKTVTGSYALSDASANDYTLATNAFSSTAAITPATLTYVATAVSVPVGSTIPTLSGTVTGFVSGETLANATTGAATWTTAATSASPLGGYSITGGGLTANNGNYAFVQAPGNASALTIVNTIALDYATADQTTTYNASAVSPSTVTVTLTNASTHAAVTDVNLTPTVVFQQKGATVTNVVAAGTYQEVVTGFTGSDASQYSLAMTGDTIGTLTINPATLTIATAGAVASTKVYDGATNATATSDGTLSGVIAADSGNVTLTLTAGYADKNVGTGKTVTGTYALTGAAAANYTLATNVFSSTAAITPATLTIAAAGAVASTKVYDGTTAAVIASNGTLGGVISGDTVALTLAASYADKNVGTGKTVTGSYALTGASDANYTLATNAFSSTAAITPATLTIATAGAVASTKVYDGATNATVTSGGTLGGVISGDTVNLTLTAAYADKNVGTGKAVTGTYALTGASDTNYTLATTSFTGTAAITPATLTIATAGAVASTKVYDGTTNVTVTSDGTLGGVISGDTVALTLAAAYSDKNVGTGKAVTGTYALTGASDTNYTLATTSFTGAAAITPATLTIATAGAVASTKVYDGATNATVTSDGTLSGVISGDTVALTLTAAYADKNVGAGKTVTGTYALTGASDANYTLATNAFSSIAAITPATLTYVANPVTLTVGSAIPTLTGSVTGFVAGETLASATTGTTAWSTAATASSPGGAYAIAGSGLTADNGDYTFVQAASNATALTIASSPFSGGPVTASEALKYADVYAPILIETGSAEGGATTGQLGGATGSFWWGAMSSWTPPSGPQNGGKPGGANNPGGVYPDNVNYGRWLHFVSL